MMGITIAAAPVLVESLFWLRQAARTHCGSGSSRIPCSGGARRPGPTAAPDLVESLVLVEPGGRDHCGSGSSRVPCPG